MGTQEKLSEVEKLVTRLTWITEQAEILEAERTVIKGRLGELLDLGSHKISGVNVIVSQPGKLDLMKIASDYPIAQYPDLYEAKPSTKAVRALIAPAVLDTEYTVPGRVQVSIR